MKRLSPEDKIRLTHLAYLRSRQSKRARTRQEKRSQKQVILNKLQQQFGDAYNIPIPIRRGRVPVMIPENLSLRDNHAETVDVLSLLRETVLTGRTPVQLYFDNLRTLEPAATLLLVAEIFRCRQLRAFRGGQTVIGNYPHDANVFRLLKQMGFFRLLDVDDRYSAPSQKLNPEAPFFLPFRTMSSVHPQLAATFVDVVAKGAFSMDDLAQKRMVASLKEAMGNAHEHAYLRPGSYPVLPNRWWLAGHLNPHHKEMMIMILDQGIGIPQTLEATIFEQIAALMKMNTHPSDGNMIAAATELFRTSTDQRGRGRGFQDMKRFVDTCDDGELRVLSNRGVYTYSKSSQTIVDHNTSIGGTLVEWRIRHHGDTVEMKDE